jgi:hypothetical protein
MKKLIGIIINLLFLSVLLTAQTPGTISYQAVVRNSSNQLIVNQEVGVKITILHGSATGTPVYTEFYLPNPQTNSNGLLNFRIGSGVPLLNVFSSINWGSGPYFIKSEIDPSGGTNYTISGTSPLLTVPYALYAAKANYNDLVNKPDLSVFATLTLLEGKVDKEAGKGLSESDYTPAEKEKLANIEAEAQKNVPSDWEAIAGDAFILNKPDLSIFATKDMQDKNIINLANPVNAQDAATKDYVDRYQARWTGEATITGSISRIGQVGIGIETPSALLHTHGSGAGEGNVLFSGTIKEETPGDPPASGAGTRMMWYPDKAAFRTGQVTGTQWDKENIGSYSSALGYNTIAKGINSTALGSFTIASGTSSTALGNFTMASGEASTAMGNSTTASGNISIAMGGFTIASGENSTAMGFFTNASGAYSTAMGFHAKASGAYSTAMGEQTIAPSAYETVMGRYNTNYTPASTTAWMATDRLFVVGRGTSDASRLNALTLLKNGNTGIGTDTPAALLHTHGTGIGEGNVLFTGSVKESTPGNPPASGAGTRMMWYSDKAAFRAGHVTGTHWNKDSIGIYSVAMGYNTVAVGRESVAIGLFTSARAGSAIAMGANSTASGAYSIAMGSGNNATENYALALGRSTTASGTISTAMGFFTTASGHASTAMGILSTASGVASTAMGKSARAVGDYSFAIHLSSDQNTAYGVSANTFRITGAAAIGGNVVWTNYSDRRLKKDIVTIASENNLAKILRLNAVRYRWIEHDQLLNLGFIAQDVLDIVPESVRYDEHNDIYSMEYTALIPILVEGMKEQQEIIEMQQVVIESQQSRLDNQQSIIDNQQSNISELKETLNRLQSENSSLRASIEELEKLKADVERIKEMFLVKE